MTSLNVVESASTVEPPQTAPSATSGSAGTPGRLAWLDVLRGVAALCVVFDHFGSFVPPRIHATVSQWLDPGTYGVFVFFLISGYIVPASLERKGSVRTFWVSRMFRRYPLYLLAIGIAVALWMALAVLLSVCSLTHLFVERPCRPRAVGWPAGSMPGSDPTVPPPRCPSWPTPGRSRSNQPAAACWCHDFPLRA